MSEVMLRVMTVRWVFFKDFTLFYTSYKWILLFRKLLLSGTILIKMPHCLSSGLTF